MYWERRTGLGESGVYEYSGGSEACDDDVDRIRGWCM